MFRNLQFLILFLITSTLNFYDHYSLCVLLSISIGFGLFISGLFIIMLIIHNLLGKKKVVMLILISLSGFSVLYEFEFGMNIQRFFISCLKVLNVYLLNYSIQESIKLALIEHGKK